MSAAERKSKNAHGDDRGVITWGLYGEILGWTHSLANMANKKLEVESPDEAGMRYTLDHMRDGLDMIVSALSRAEKVD